MSCAICGDSLQEHPLRACRKPGCPCLRYIEDNGADLPLASIGWQGMVMTGVLELVAGEAEGSVHVSTHDLRECVVKITFRPLAPYNSPSGGKA